MPFAAASEQNFCRNAAEDCNVTFLAPGSYYP
jgi:hypothetical protein